MLHPQMGSPITPHFGNSMRSLALLRLVGGKISGSRCVLRPGGVLEDMFWNIDIFTCVLVGSEFP